MWINTEKNINELNNSIRLILNSFSESDYELVDPNKEFPLLTSLSDEKYEFYGNKIIKLRDETIDCFINNNNVIRNKISTAIKKFEYFDMVFIPNKNRLEVVENKERYLFKILICLCIQNLNDDIRDLIL